MTEEFSAGGIVFRKGLDSGENQNDVFILVSQHSGHHGWVFPKGHVADTIPNETEQEAAVREVQEETGITGTILEPLSLVDYWYVFRGEKRHKTVQYFLMAYESGNTEDHGWEMENVVWLLISEVEKKLTYKSDKKVWEEAKKKLLQKIK
ncbi:MAG TPA: NUDIX domain-containing protein [Patescibacteria group bacterium]|nr:NUDIX domain-containing protein [Patescibacteria group bacterium]